MFSFFSSWDERFRDYILNIPTQIQIFRNLFLVNLSGKNMLFLRLILSTQTKLAHLTHN